MNRLALKRVCGIALAAAGVAASAFAESPYLYGIHDYDPRPTEYLSRISNGGATGWITATEAVGADANNHAGKDFRELADLGHTVICRINYGYSPEGTIPPRSMWDDFAQRCANFVASSQGCGIWLIANETNLAAEWPLENERFSYVSPQDYAELFRKVYDAIKAVRPDDKVISQALAPWAGPYGEGTHDGKPHDGMPLNWVQYKHQMLTAIAASGPLDGIGIHINSRGYSYDDIHSTHQINAGGQMLYFSFYVYKDWIEFGIPQSLWHLPLYATESNGNYFWKGGHDEAPEKTYEAGWMQEVYAEINRYNQEAATNGKPIFRCINMYRWCAGCDGWNIDGSPQKAQILSDLDAAVAQLYQWPASTNEPPDAPLELTAAATPGRITLNWSEIPDASWYEVKRALASEGPYTVLDGNFVGTVFTDTSFQPGTAYHYAVNSVNSAEESSEPATVFVSAAFTALSVVVSQGEESNLPVLYSSEDLIHGLIATELPGDMGWYPANTNPADQLPAFTDGEGMLGSGLTGLLNDFPAAGNPAKRIEYALTAPADIGEIRVFSGNNGRDGRVFHTYTAQFSSDDGETFGPRIYVQSHSSGTVNSVALNWRVVLSQLSSEGFPLAENATHIRLDFYSVSDTAGVMRDPFSGINLLTGMDDSMNAAFESPLVWEIDVLPYEGPPQLQAELDGTNIVIAWPASASGFVLQSSDTLAPVDWNDITPQPEIEIIDGANRVIIPVENGTKFYQLRR